MEIDQEIAKRLFMEGGILIFLNVPKGTIFGIDMKIWNTDENFRGIKMIPPGIHFVHYSAISKTGEQAPRSGFFYNFKKSEIVAKRYDQKTEDICDQIPQSDIVKLKQNIIHMDKFLGPYPYDVKNKWISLINYVSDDLVKELSPKSQFIRSALILTSCSDADRPRGINGVNSTCTSKTGNITSNNNQKRRFRNDEDDLLPDLKPVEGTELRFTKFPELNYPEGATPAEITKHSLDSTYVLEIMLKRYSSVTDFIGELQFAFVCFLVGHSLEAFEQWKKLVCLICSCENAIKKYRSLYDMFISVLEIQLNETPPEFLADIVSNNNLIYLKLRLLFSSVQESDVDGRLKMKISRFKENLSRNFFWDFSNLDEEDDDEKPIIVNLDDE